MPTTRKYVLDGKDVDKATFNKYVGSGNKPPSTSSKSVSKPKKKY